MKLTQKQEWLVARYLRDVGAALGDVSDAAREQALTRIRARLHAELRRLPAGDGPFSDEAVAAVLRRLGDPAKQAAEFTDTLGETGKLVLSTQDRRWLGVCAGLAEYLGVEATAVRIAAILLGATGPLALIGYLALYFKMYWATETPDLPRIDKGRIARYLPATLSAALALHFGIRGLLSLVVYAYNTWAGLGAFPDLGRWDWLRLHAPFMLFCVLFLLLPLALLSALPLPSGWDLTGKRLVQAGLAVYVLVLSFGTALFLVGAILHVVTQFSG
jgi:phage shock protein PspC (stress-responsive transcriptional regulator)